MNFIHVLYKKSQFIANQVGARFVAPAGEEHVPMQLSGPNSPAESCIASAGNEAASLENEASATAASSSSALDTPQSESTQETEEPSGKQPGKKKGRVVNVEEILPKPSYWPLALAASFVVLLMGIMISWIVMAIGAMLVIASVMGWSLERR